MNSFALDQIKKPEHGRSRRIMRGLCKSYVGQLINADINEANYIL